MYVPRTRCSRGIEIFDRSVFTPDQSSILIYPTTNLSRLPHCLDRVLCRHYSGHLMPHTEQSETQGRVPPQCCTLDIDGAEQQRLVEMFRGVANPVRFEILKFLLTHPGCITGDLVEHLPIAQATVSQHLKVMKASGWIEGRIHGPATNYCLVAQNVDWFRDRVGEIF